MQRGGKLPSPLKAIRSKCLSCSLTSNEVKECTVETCPLFHYRLGKNPNRKPRKMTEEQRVVAVERLKKARELRGLKDECNR